MKSLTPVCKLALAVALLGVLAVRPSAGPQTPAAPAGPATIAVDFLATNADGRPITDLKAEELTLKIDGRARAIHSLQLVQAKGPSGARDASAPPPPFGSNAAGDVGRAVILVFDQDSMLAANTRATQQAASMLLAGLLPQDRVAIVTVPYGGIKIDLTTDRELLTKGINEVTAQAATGESLSDAACRTRTTLQSLTGLLESLSGGSGPTTVVFFTAQLTGPRSVVGPGRTPSSNPLAPAVQNTMGGCDLQTEEFEHVGAAAAAARAYFYIARIDDTSIASSTTITTSNRGAAGNIRGSDSPTAGIFDLAGVTGGIQFPMLAGGSGDSMLIRVAMETSAYYLVTFEPDAADRNGAHHRVELKAMRDGIALRTLPTLVIPSADAAANAPVVTPKVMLHDAKPYRDLPLRTAAYSSRNQSNGQVKVVALFEPTDDLTTLATASAGLYDKSGKLVATWNAVTADLSKTPVSAALVVQPGTYRLRVAAQDTGGRSGATDTEVVARLADAGPLKLSDIVLGRTMTNGFAPKLMFTSEPVATAYLEFYGGQENMGVRVAFELARTVDGPPMVAEPASIETTTNPDRFRVTASLPIGSLDPGDYVVRALVEVEGQPFGRVTRTLRKGTQ